MTSVPLHPLPLSPLPHTPYGRVRLARFARVRLARFARVRLLRHALPISLLILRKKPTVLKSTFNVSLITNFLRFNKDPQRYVPQVFNSSFLELIGYPV